MHASRRTIASLACLATAIGAGLLATACGGGGSGDFSNSSLVTLSAGSMPAGATGQPYVAQLAANFPHPPGQFVVSAGRLPPGVVLDPLSGAITGFPRQTGRFNFDISARDGTDPTLPPNRDTTFSEAVRPFSLDVSLGTPNILPQVIPAAQYRHSYLYAIDVAGGTSPYTFTVPSGTLPTGITLSQDGHLGNFPTQANVSQGVPFQFDAMVTDANGHTDLAHFALNVVVLPLIILTSSINEAALDFAYDVQLELASNGGGQPITWSQAAPTGTEVSLASIGMEITADGHIRNSIAFPGPTTMGTHTFTIQVTDEASQVTSRQYSLKVNPGPVLTSITPSLASLQGPYVVTGSNFQVGAVLAFKPGPSEVTITPTFVSSTQLRFNTAPSAPGGAGGGVAVKVVNPDGGSYTKPGAFVFTATTVAFGTKGFLSSSLSSTGVDCADVNGDGWADIAHCGAAGFSAYSDSPISSAAGLIYHRNLSTAAPTFGSLTLSSSNFYDCKFADVNLDGKLDIVGLAQTSIQVFLNGVSGNPLGTFTAGPVSPLPSGFTWPSEMTIGRFNSDLLPDLAFGVANYPTYSYSGSVYLMLGNGAGGFSFSSSATSTITSTYGVISLCCADSDGDGIDEICAGVGKNPYSGPMWNYSAVSGGSFGGWGGRGGTITSPGYGSTTGIIAADFQGTGVKSVLAAMTGAPAYSNVRAMSLYSSSTYSSQTVLSPPTDVTKCLTAVDADFDLKMDFAVTTNLGNIEVYRGSSLTSVLTIDTSAGSPSVSSPRTGRMASGDLDGDGRPDILATTSYWACEGMASSHGSYYALGVVGDGGSQGVVFYLNTSN